MPRPRVTYEQYQKDRKIRAEIDKYLGSWSAYMGIPELAWLLLGAYSDGAAADEIGFRVRQTNWYKQNNDTRRLWPSLSPADQKKRIWQAQLQVAQYLREIFGPSMFEQRYSGGVNNESIAKTARMIASGELDPVAWQWYARGVAEGVEGSAAFTARLEEEAAARSGAVKIENLAQQIRDQAAQRWLVPVSEGAAKKWATDLVANIISNADVEQYFRQQAAALFPAWAKQIERGVDPATLFSPYQQIAVEDLERIVDFGDPLMSEVLVGRDEPLTLSQFRRLIRSRPEWNRTTKANELADSLSGRLLNMFGAKG